MSTEIKKEERQAERQTVLMVTFSMSVSDSGHTNGIQDAPERSGMYLYLPLSTGRGTVTRLTAVSSAFHLKYELN